MKKRIIYLIIFIISTIIFLISSTFNIKQSYYKNNYVAKEANITNIKVNNKTNSYINYVIGSQIINVELKKKMDNQTGIKIYYNPNKIDEYVYQRSTTISSILIVLSLISLLVTSYLLFINKLINKIKSKKKKKKKTKKDITFYEFKSTKK